MWSRTQFDADFQAGTLCIALIGMSNAGKSERAKKLKKQSGFTVVDIDTLIQQSLGLRDMKNIAEWLGYPDTPAYAERAQKYIDAEDSFTRAACSTVVANTIIDTTGSIAHLSASTQDFLKEHALVVHLKVDSTSEKALIERFFATPKPVIWGDFFTQRDGEDIDAALRRSYPLLLKYRLEKYTALAHVTLPAERIYALKGPALLERIRSLLSE